MPDITTSSNIDSFMQAADYAAMRALLNVENGATADQTQAEIVTLWELETGRDASVDGAKLDTIATGAQVNTVLSVNSLTGNVVLDPDDLSDAATANKFTTAADIAKLAGIEVGAEVNNISDVNAAALVAGTDTSLHHHDSRYYTETELTNGSLSLDLSSLNVGPGNITLDALSTVDGRDLSVDGTKLDGIEAGATGDQSDAEIETAYNNQVAVVSQIDAEAGVSTTVYRWTPERVGQAIAALATGGATTLDGLTDVVITTPADNEVLAYDNGSGNWINQTPAEAGLAAASHTHTLIDVTDSGALAALNTVGTAQIDNDAVTYAKMQNVSATDKLLGRSTAGAGDVEEIACTAAGRALLDDADAAAQRTTLGLDNNSSQLELSSLNVGHDTGTAYAGVHIKQLDDAGGGGIKFEQNASTVTWNTYMASTGNLLWAVGATPVSAGTSKLILDTNGGLEAVTLIGNIAKLNNIRDYTDNKLVLNIDGAGASAVNYFTMGSSATGDPVNLSAGGTDTNVSLNIASKGSGVVTANGVEVVTLSGSQTLTNKTLTNPRIGNDIYDVNGNILFQFSAIPSSVNYIGIQNAAVTGTPVISSWGSDTNVSLIIAAKGTGNINIGNFKFDADQAIGAGQDNYVLTYDNATGLISLEASTGGSNPAINDVTDITITTPADNEVLAYDSGSGEWINQTAAEAGLAAASHTHVKADITDYDGIANVVEDTTPQLGGNLDVQTHRIQDASGTYYLDPDNTSISLYVAGPAYVGPSLGINNSSSSDSSLHLKQFLDNHVGGIKIERTGANQQTYTIWEDTSNILNVGYAATPGSASSVVTINSSGAITSGGVEVPTISSTSTLTNKTLDSPKINAIYDASGVINTLFQNVGGGGSYLQFNTYSSLVEIQALGTNASLYFTPTGTGKIYSNFVEIADISSAQTLTNKTINGDNNTLSNLDIGLEVDWAAAADVADRSAAPATGDKLLIFEAGVGLRKIDWDDLPGAGGGISNVVEDTTPQLGGQLDVNGFALGDGTLELLAFTETASAVNHINITNATTGNGPTISAVGDDANVTLNLSGKGTGIVNFTSNADFDGTVGFQQSCFVYADMYFSNAGFGGLTSFGLIFDLIDTASAVNYLTATNAITTNAPVLSAAGTDTNINLNLEGKGTGVVTAGGVEVVTLSGSQTLTNKNLTAPVIDTDWQIHQAVNDLLIDRASSTMLQISSAGELITLGNIYPNAGSDPCATTTGTETLTNKTINADNNTISNIGFAEIKADIITGATEELSPASGDFLLGYDTTAGALRKFDIGNLPGGGGGINNVVEDTTPQLGGQLDVNGQAIGDGTLELLTFTETASAVNHVNITNATTTNGPTVGAAGDDTNIDLNLTGKGTGQVLYNSENVAVETITLTAGETVSAGQAGYVKSDGAIWLTDASASATAGPVLCGIILNAATATQACTLQIRGKYTTTGLTAGSAYFLSETAGAITATAPTTDASIQRIVGYALSTTVLEVSPDETYVEVSTGGLAIVDDTTPQLGGQLDVNGNGLGDGTNLLLGFVEDASAVNYVQIENEATGAGPIIRAVGTDANIDLQLAAKGTARVYIPSSIRVNNGNSIQVDNRAVLRFQESGTSVNYFQANSTATGNPPNFSAYSLTDTNVDLNLKGQGTGVLHLGGNQANYVTVNGSVTTAPVSIQAAGSDTNIDLDLLAKGTGRVTDGTNNILTTASIDTLTNKTIIDATNSVGLLTLDIDGGTDIGADLTDADLFIVDDGGAGTNRKCAASRIKTYVAPTLSRSVTIIDPTATDDATIFFTPVAITVAAVHSHITGATNVVFNVSHASTRTGTPLDVFTSDITLTSTAGQTNNTGFNDATIPANSWVWLDVVSVSGTPTMFHATVEYTED